MFFKVKVLSFTGLKVSLSMKDVNQDTGEDLNPTSNNLLLGKDRFVVLFINSCVGCTLVCHESQQLCPSYGTLAVRCKMVPLDFGIR